MLESVEKYDFDREFEEKGGRLLDTIFCECPELRSMVSFKNPRECNNREVIFEVNYNAGGDFSAVLGIICSWLKNENSQGELESMMLF